MRIAVMTDSNSGITQTEADSLGIFLVPMPIIIDGETFYEGVNLTQDYFYSCLTGGKEVTTSQPSPGVLLEQWDRILSLGYDRILYIPMSSGLSQSCATAISLSKDYEGKVLVADNHRISVPQKISVLEAIRMVEKGIPAEKIHKSLEDNSFHSSIYVAVDTLEYLKKGGRITPAAAALGTILNLKPVLTIQGSRLDAFAKVRGIKKARQKMAESLADDLNTRFSQIPKERLRLDAAGSGLSKEEIQELTDFMEQKFKMEVHYDPLSLCIGTHTGPGAVGMALSVLAEVPK